MWVGQQAAKFLTSPLICGCQNVLYQSLPFTVALLEEYCSKIIRPFHAHIQMFREVTYLNYSRARKKIAIDTTTSLSCLFNKTHMKYEIVTCVPVLLGPCQICAVYNVASGSWKAGNFELIHFFQPMKSQNSILTNHETADQSTLAEIV